MISPQQPAAGRGQARRRNLIAGGSIAAVLAIVAGFIIVHSLGGAPAVATTPAGSHSSASSVVQEIVDVPAATLDQVAAGGVYPHAIQTIRPTGPLLVADRKPEVVFVGAQYCPYCAAERWALAVALSRFGAFSGLQLIRSSSTDVYPNTATLSFYRSSYSSKRLVFVSTEVATDNPQVALQPLTALDKTVMRKYDAPPYLPAADSPSFPFVDFGNKYVIDGASYSPQVLAGLTWRQIGADLANPASPVAKGIDGAANHIIAAICRLTNGQPGAVCSSTGVTAIGGSI
jgi:hypothetical protein